MSSLITETVLTVKCQHCGRSYSVYVPEVQEGFKIARCPHCKQTQNVYIGYRYKIEPYVAGYDKA
jgi:NAD-dependent SIR2 family protein deacetylase